MTKSKKLKENPVLKDKTKNKKNNKIINKSLNNVSEEEHVIRNFVIIIVVICVIVGGFYFISEFVQKDKNLTNNEEKEEASINYNIVTVGTMLNRPYDNYYVLVYDSSSDEAIKYSTLLSMYSQHETEDDYIKIYFCDLNDKLNNKYYDVNNDKVSNPKAKDIKDFDFGDLTLLQIKKGKITSYLEDYSDIEEKLK